METSIQNFSIGESDFELSKFPNGTIAYIRTSFEEKLYFVSLSKEQCNIVDETLYPFHAIMKVVTDKSIIFDRKKRMLIIVLESNDITIHFRLTFKPYLFNEKLTGDIYVKKMKNDVDSDKERFLRHFNEYFNYEKRTQVLKGFKVKIQMQYPDANWFFIDCIKDELVALNYCVDKERGNMTIIFN